MEATLMKNPQLLQAWSMRSITRGDGRRLITVWRGEEPATSANHNAGRARRGQPIAVKFSRETSSAFTPAIRQSSMVPVVVPPSAANIQLPETL